MPKFLFEPALSVLSTSLSRVIGDCELEFRAESYSLKVTQDDKRLQRELEAALTNEAAIRRGRSSSFSHPNIEESNVTVLHLHSTLEADRDKDRTLRLLISTLNAAFPDYDFMERRENSFEKIPSLSHAIGVVNAALCGVADEEARHPTLAAELKSIEATTPPKLAVKTSKPATNSSDSRKRSRSKSDVTVSVSGVSTSELVVSPLPLHILNQKSNEGNVQPHPPHPHSSPLLTNKETMKDPSAKDSSPSLITRNHEPVSVNNNVLPQTNNSSQPGGSSSGHSFLDLFWETLNNAINLQSCDIYSSSPDLDSDPFSDDTIWSFNFMFLNRQLNRILFLCCLARRAEPTSSSSSSSSSAVGVIDGANASSSDLHQSMQSVGVEKGGADADMSPINVGRGESGGGGGDDEGGGADNDDDERDDDSGGREGEVDYDEDDDVSTERRVRRRRMEASMSSDPSPSPRSSTFGSVSVNDSEFHPLPSPSPSISETNDLRALLSPMRAVKGKK